MKKKFSTILLAASIAFYCTSSFAAAPTTAGDRGAESHVLAATSGSIASNAPQSPGNLQAVKDATEAGANRAPGFFFLIGFGLIGLRLVVSNWPKKVKNLAPDTH
jgi:hypothetical protein